MSTTVVKGSAKVYGGRTVADRAAEAEAMLADYVKGMRATQLAEKYGVSHATASRRIKKAIDARMRVTTEAYREQQNALLDELMAGHQKNYDAGTLLVQQGSVTDIETGEPKSYDLIERGLNVCQRALEGMGRVAERRHKLNGVDAPVRSEVEVVTVTTQEKELRDLLVAAAQAQQAREAELVEDEA